MKQEILLDTGPFVAVLNRRGETPAWISLF